MDEILTQDKGVAFDYHGCQIIIKSNFLIIIKIVVLELKVMRKQAQ